MNQKSGYFRWLGGRKTTGMITIIRGHTFRLNLAMIKSSKYKFDNNLYVAIDSGNTMHFIDKSVLPRRFSRWCFNIILCSARNYWKYQLYTTLVPLEV